MESITGITVLDSWLAKRAKDLQVESIEIVRIQDFPLIEELTELEKGKTNTILKESAAGDELMLVYSYEIDSPVDLQVVVEMNADTIISSDKLKLDFVEPYIVEPSRELQIKESHENGTIPLKIFARTVLYRMALPAGV